MFSDRLFTVAGITRGTGGDIPVPLDALVTALLAGRRRLPLLTEGAPLRLRGNRGEEPFPVEGVREECLASL